MGKYHTTNQDNIITTQDHLCHISNELAEANRLKLLELKHLFHNQLEMFTNTEPERIKLIKELEDQA